MFQRAYSSRWALRHKPKAKSRDLFVLYFALGSFAAECQISLSSHQSCLERFRTASSSFFSSSSSAERDLEQQAQRTDSTASRRQQQRTDTNHSQAVTLSFRKNTPHTAHTTRKQHPGKKNHPYYRLIF